MNLHDILKYGHHTVVQAIDGYPEAAWHEAGAVGVWSPKDIVAHLATFELLMVDVLRTVLGEGPTPYLDGRGMTPAEVVAELDAAHAEVMRLAGALTPEQAQAPGTLPWYGAEYALDDFVVYTQYGHKREHTAQLKLFRKRFA
jgi:hypothetical protein